MSTSKPQPLHPGPKRKVCPVCGEYSYSRGGVHPQCSVRQADEKRMQRLKREQASKAPAKPAVDVKPWQKICPKCKNLIHIRKQVCVCGHQNAAATASRRQAKS
ncbi:MAG: hypothetical protein KDA93_05700 [Planctomycetaceae bacterium]|nr:hypothetical protein [Planctomycetaceae bacterium]